MEFHPIANVFPLMQGEKFDELVNSIKTEGLHEPITIHENKILDGRNRWRACQEAGVEPKIRKLNGENPFTFVIVQNLIRRQLSPTQCAMAAAEIANMRQGDNRFTIESQNCASITQDEAARLMGVSPRSVSTAEYVKKNGTATEIEEAKLGKTRLGNIADRIRKRTRTKLEAELNGAKPRKKLVTRIDQVSTGMDIIEQAISGAVEIYVLDFDDDTKELIRNRISTSIKQLGSLRKRLGGYDARES